jgi:hypothetical protein
MKKLSFFLFVASALFAGEIRIGSGDMGFSGGFLGFDKKVTEGITTFGYEQNHKNIFGSKSFYCYNITWYDSDHFKQMQSIYNTGVNQLFSWMPPIVSSNVFVPTMDYRLQGLDASLSLGYDLSHKDENNYFGIGGYLGINLPWIDSQKDSSYLDNIPAGIDVNKLYDFYKVSKTDIQTYKLGVGIYTKTSLTSTLSVYANGVYAYQTGSMENDYAKSDFNVDGTYKSLDIGLRYSPYQKNHRFLEITWSPRVYITAGYKLERWSVDDVAIDISGMGINMPKTTMKFDTDIGYLGFGYSF